MKKVFTTGEVARICQVAPRTVSKWFDMGRLKGYRVPSSGDRRIPRQDLIAFLREHGLGEDGLDAFDKTHEVKVDEAAEYADMVESRCREEQWLEAERKDNLSPDEAAYEGALDAWESSRGLEEEDRRDMANGL